MIKQPFEMNDYILAQMLKNLENGKASYPICGMDSPGPVIAGIVGLKKLRLRHMGRLRYNIALTMKVRVSG